MNIKFKGLVLGTALSAFAFTACETAPTNTANKGNVTVSNNTAVVTNGDAKVTTSGGNTTTVSETGNSSSMWNANITRADYDKDKTRYESEAKKAGSTVGQGANDMWIWTKTRSALATTNELRDSTINVDVSNDMITLKGTVATKEQMMKAESVAKSIDGQKGVKNELKVAAGDSMANMNTNSVVNGNTKK